MEHTRYADGSVYTETVVYSAPEQYAADAPYQLAIVELDDAGGRLTVRIRADNAGERVRIGDRVRFVEEVDGVAFYNRAGAGKSEEA